MLDPHPPALAERQPSYLAVLAERVRQLRARRGMSRRILAAASGVSERYLAQLEAGRGNASVLVLAAIAEALNVAPDDLLDARTAQSVEYRVLRERLRTADDALIERLLACSDDRPAGAAEPRHLALIGLRGAGKSTLGAALGKRLGLPFVELVQEIEREAGRGVADIFAAGGQSAYRRFERRALEAVLARFERAVIAVGGSLVSEPETYARLLARCVTVWLKAAPRAHMTRVVAQGDLRPMADNRHAMADLKRILAERAALYARADFSLDTSAHGIEAALDILLGLAPVRALAPAT